MKITFFLLATCITTFIFSQKVEVGTPMEPLKSAFGMVYCSDFFAEIEDVNYTVQKENFGTTNCANYYWKKNSRTGEISKSERIQIENAGLKGEIFAFDVVDGSLIELVRFIKSTAIATKCKVAIVKRDPKTLKTEKVIMLEQELSIGNSQEFPKVVLRGFVNGFFVAVLGQKGEKQSNFISKYDSEMTLLLSEKIDFLKDDYASANELTVSNSGTAILEINFEVGKHKVFFKGQEVLTTKTNLLIIDQKSEINLVSLKYDNDFTSDKRVFYFDENKNTIKGLYFIFELKGQQRIGQGYCFFSWNLEGEILNSERKILTNSDILNDKVISYLQTNRLKTIEPADQLLPLLVNEPQVTFHENGEVLIFYPSMETTKSSKQNDLLKKSRLLFVLNDEGAIKAKKLFLTSLNESYTLFNVGYIGGDIYVFFKEFISSSSSNYLMENQMTKSNATNSACFYGKFNCESLELEDVKKYQLEDNEYSWGYFPKSASHNSFSLIFVKKSLYTSVKFEF